MAQKYYAAEPIWLTLSDKPGTLQYIEVLWNIMRMLLMSEGMDAESALEALNEMPATEYDRLKARAAAEYADPQIQDYLERINLYPGTPTAPQLKPVGMPYEVLDEMDWQGFKMWLTDKDSERVSTQQKIQIRWMLTRINGAEVVRDMDPDELAEWILDLRKNKTAFSVSDLGTVAKALMGME